MIATREPYFSDELALVYCQAGAKLGGLLCLSGLARSLSEKEQDLLNLFAQQIQLALNNVLREQDTQDFIRRTLEHAQELERDHLFSEDKQLHPAAKVAAVLAQALGLPLENHENVALAAMIAALLAPYSAVGEGHERTQARLGYERFAAGFTGSPERPNRRDDVGLSCGRRAFRASRRRRLSRCIARQRFSSRFAVIGSCYANFRFAKSGRPHRNKHCAKF